MSPKYHAPKRVLILRIISAFFSTILVSLALIIQLFSTDVDEETTVLELTDNQILIAVLIGIALIAIVIVFIVLVYRRFKFYDDGKNLVVQRGLFFKRTTTIPYENINVVAKKRNLFEMMLGLSRVTVDTGTTASLLAEAVIPVKKNYADHLKDFLEDKKTNLDVQMPSPLTIHDAKDDSGDVFFKMRSSQLFAMGLTREGVLTSVVSVLMMFIPLITLGAIVEPDVTFDNTYLLGAILVSIAIAVFIVLLIMVGQFIYLYKFTLKIDSTHLEYQYGLLASNQFKINLERINAVRIKQSLLYRLFKRYAVEISVIGIENINQENKNNQSPNRSLLPFAKLDKVEELLTLLGQEHLLENDYVGPTKFKWTNFVLIPGVFAGLIAAGLIALSLLAFSQLVVLLIVLIIALYLLILTGLILRMKNHGYKITGNHIIVRSGSFTIKRTSILKSRIQTVHFNQNPVQILQGIGNVRLHYKDVFRNARILHQDVSHFDIVNKEI